MDRRQSAGDRAGRRRLLREERPGERGADGREIGEHDRPLAGFKRRYRKAEGVKRIKRGADIPIAVLVPRVVLKKRLDIDQLVARRIPRLTAAIEARIRQLG
ncbi:DUF6441 family protein [Ralstonia pseudosolanacearum]|uniref:DUF6441 family protein n=2 Tax=Ralstonia solanacearum species complex TaxID=3116862 RepID=A0ABY6NHC1_RALSL|nr:DUF6441 family protein [Ralstonia solanacearum]UZF26806.1 DUF6441 family protein [Ralstonia sp. RS642]UZF31802.1 DUF6441 family protein [Ralstonia sp. RS650]